MITYGVAARPLPGQDVAGDLYLIGNWERRTVVAVVDGLGHGGEAALAAGKALEAIRASASADIARLLLACHQRLRGTRGVVMTLACLDPGSGMMSWLGIGNVEGVLVRSGTRGKAQARDFALRRAGIVGCALPNVQPVATPLGPGDTLVLATDGIRKEFVEAVSAAEAPQALADRLLERYSVDSDDALVLVARWLGPDHA